LEGGTSHHEEVWKMKRALSVAAAVIALSASTGSELAAQWEAGLPGQDVASVTLHLGAVAPTTTFPQGDSYGTGIGGGISGIYWFHNRVGIRGSFLLGKTPGQPSPTYDHDKQAGLENPTVWYYGGEFLLRHPMEAGERFAWFPYIAAGAGGKQYRWEQTWTGFNRDYTYTTNFAAGIDIRPTDSPWYGFALEARMFNSKYKWHTYYFDQPTQRDLIITAGFKLNR
jgi:hypothetical protein